MAKEARGGAMPASKETRGGAQVAPTDTRGPLAACACAAGERVGPGGRAVAVDAETTEANLKRLRRIEGQVRGLQKMVQEGRYCADVLTQIASVHEALRAVGRELMRNHLKHCATSAIREGGPEADRMYEELLDLMYRQVR